MDRRDIYLTSNNFTHCVYLRSFVLNEPSNIFRLLSLSEIVWNWNGSDFTRVKTVCVMWFYLEGPYHKCFPVKKTLLWLSPRKLNSSEHFKHIMSILFLQHTLPTIIVFIWTIAIHAFYHSCLSKYTCNWLRPSWKIDLSNEWPLEVKALLTDSWFLKYFNPTQVEVNDNRWTQSITTVTLHACIGYTIVYASWQKLNFYRCSFSYSKCVPYVFSHARILNCTTICPWLCTHMYHFIDILTCKYLQKVHKVFNLFF